ncbi:very long chain fatty acid elongase AAEL008004-like [Ornithodoros turicata]|uniref:very long chain fatty acid elongase AAEL008004-like n=1 Tax=Ornithodoros turicata TaxID=34597 RepID=UPI00313A2687
MSTIISLDSFLTDYLHLPQDPRTKDWVMVKYPSMVLSTIGLYLYFVKVWGPNYMKGRQPYNLKTAILLYNAFMVVASTVFLVRILSLTYVGGGYSLFCQGLDYSTAPMAMELLNVYWWLRIVRLADFLDTIFFVLRKKFSQVSALHVVHHALVALDCWFWHRIGTDGHSSFIICLNTFVHVVMYSYYLLSSLGPHMQKYLWWKRYLTQLQITQFIVAMFHGSIPLFYDCGYPKLYVYFAMPQGVLFLYLFFQFYFKVYIHRPGKGFHTVCNAQTGLITQDEKQQEVKSS